MRIAVVVNAFPVLSESFIFNKVMGLRAAGVDVTVIAGSLINDAALFADRLPEDWTNFVRYTANSGGNKAIPAAILAYARQNPRVATQVWRAAHTSYDRKRALKAFTMALPIAVGNFDLVHFEFSGIASTYMDALPLLKPARLLCSCRGSAEQIAPLTKPHRAEQLRMLFPKLDRVHCISYDLLSIAESYGLSRDRAFVNYPAIDINKFHRTEPYKVREHGSICIVSTGRLHWKKGFEFSLLALRQLLDEGFEVHYKLVGVGPEEEKLRFCIAELGLSSRVELLGRQDASNIKNILEAADIYWFPSISEGVGNAALEAMSMMLPIVATDTGGLKEQILDGENGLLVTPFDAHALADKTAILLRDGALRKRIGEAARERIEKHCTLQRQIEVFVHEYSQLLAQ